MRVPATTEDVQPPSAPSNLSAAGGFGQVSLNWTAATDNVAVSQYRVHRSTVPGFTPGAANFRASTASTSNVDSSLSAGTYYYRVLARDAAGNEGPASNEASATVTSDGQAPTVTITAPASGASVSGTVTVSATASDNIAVVGVRFMLDGAALGAEDASAPYSVSWNTSSAAPRAAPIDSNRTRRVGQHHHLGGCAGHGHQRRRPSRLVVALGFDEGTGTTSNDASGLGTSRRAVEHRVDALGQVRRRRSSFNGTTSWVDHRRYHDARPHHRHDVVGMGPADERERRLSDRDAEGARARTCHTGSMPPTVRRARPPGTSTPAAMSRSTPPPISLRRHLGAPRRDLRRSHAASLCQRRPGGHAEAVSGDILTSTSAAAHWRQCRLGRVLRRRHRRGPDRQPGAGRDRDSERHGDADRSAGTAAASGDVDCRCIRG